MTTAAPPRLWVLTDRTQLPLGRALVDAVRRCARAGAPVVVVRELDLGERERSALARALGEHLPVVAAHTPLPGTVGVHLAAHQPVADAAGLPHGRSCHDADEVVRAVAEGASWVTVSPAHETRSKPGRGPALGADGVRRLVQAAGDTPVLALGGIDATDVPALRSAGAHGVAVMGAIMRSPDPGSTVTDLLSALEAR